MPYRAKLHFYLMTCVKLMNLEIDVSMPYRAKLHFYVNSVPINKVNKSVSMPYRAKLHFY